MIQGIGTELLFEPGGPAEIHGVDVILEPTRTMLVALTIDRPGVRSVYVDRRGFRVHRWVFTTSIAPGAEAPRLRAAFAGEPPAPALIRWLSFEEVQGPPPGLPADKRGSAVRDWFMRRRQEIEAEHVLGRAPLFFLELERVTSPDLLRETLEDELTPNQITERLAIMKNVTGKLARRLYWRIRNMPVNVQRVPFIPAQIEYLSDLLMGLLQAHFSPMPGRCPLDPGLVLDGFVRFAAGDFSYLGAAHANGRPDGAFFFFFAEFALVASGHPHAHAAAWRTLIGPLVMAQRVYVHAHGPPAKPFNEYEGRPTDALPAALRQTLVASWDCPERPQACDCQIQRNVWEAFRGGWYRRPPPGVRPREVPKPCPPVVEVSSTVRRLTRRRGGIAGAVMS